MIFVSKDYYLPRDSIFGCVYERNQDISIGGVAAEKKMQPIYFPGHARLCRHVVILLP